MSRTKKVKEEIVHYEIELGSNFWVGIRNLVHKNNEVYDCNLTLWEGEGVLVHPFVVSGPKKQIEEIKKDLDTMHDEWIRAKIKEETAMPPLNYQPEPPPVRQVQEGVAILKPGEDPKKTWLSRIFSS